MPGGKRIINIQTISPGMPVGPLSQRDPRACWFPAIPGFRTISPSKDHNFAPRIGMAYRPEINRGVLKEIFGEAERAASRELRDFLYGISGTICGNHVAGPAVRYNYLSPAPPFLPHRSSMRPTER